MPPKQVKEVTLAKGKPAAKKNETKEASVKHEVLAEKNNSTK